MVAGLSGCGGSDTTTPAATTSLIVTPSLGLIRNASVTVRNGAGTVVGTATMNDSGTVTINASGSGPWIVEVSGNANADYFDESLEAFVPFTAGTLRALVPAGTTTVGVTALTDLAWSLWNGSGTTLTDGNANAANTTVLNAFAPSAGLTSLLTPPTVVDSLAAGALGGSAADVYATILAGFAELGAGETAPALAAIAQLREDIADGDIDGQNGTTSVSSTLLYTPASFTSELQALVNTASSDWGTGAAIAIAPIGTPSWSNVGNGYPAAGNFTAQTHGGGACAVTINGANATVAAGAYSYTVALDGHYFETTGGEREIGPLIFGAGTVRNYSGHAGQQSVDLNIDANGHLIYAYASNITDHSELPAAGANVYLWCAGSAFTGAIDDLPASGPNGAAASQFTSTALVGTYNAPYNADGSGACNFTLDANGNVTLNTSPIAAIANGTAISYTLLNAGSQTATNAQWEYHPTVGGDWYIFYVIRQPGGETLLNVLTNGSNPKTCSTANDPTAKWAAIGAQSGNYSGTTPPTGNTDIAHGANHACSLMIEPSGDVFYVASNGEHLNTGPTASGVSVSTTVLNSGASADYIETATFALILDLAHNQVIATKDYTYYDYCNLN